MGDSELQLNRASFLTPHLFIGTEEQPPSVTSGAPWFNKPPKFDLDIDEEGDGFLTGRVEIRKQWSNGE